MTDTPSGECIYDVDGIMKSLAAVIQSTNDNDLAEIEMVKKAVELIFNGKILKPEDVTFTNPQNASYLIKKIGSNVDEKTKNYLILKIKQPLIKQRDQQKLDIAALKKDVNVARDIQKNKSYAVRDIIKGADYIDIVKAENPSKVCFDKNSIMFLDSGVFNLYVDARKDSGESSRMWISIGVDG